jgi:predicted TIM-barrel fold metal-dependent hydrolase
MTLTVLEPEGLYPDTDLEQRIMGPSVRILQGACKTSLAELPDELCQQAEGLMTLRMAVPADQIARFPKLKVVLLESGVSWLPAFLWGLVKSWKGVRFEVPWLDRPPSEYVRDHVRLSIRPLDVPEEAATMARLMDHLGSDELLLWSSDWPHAHFEGDATVPQGLDPGLLKKIMVDNPRATYARLREGELA